MQSAWELKNYQTPHDNSPVSFSESKFVVVFRTLSDSKCELHRQWKTTGLLCFLWVNLWAISSAYVQHVFRRKFYVRSIAGPSVTLPIWDQCVCVWYDVWTVAMGNHRPWFQQQVSESENIVKELCESRGGRPGLSVLTSLLVSVNIKLYWTVLRHWSQLVLNMSTDIWGH